jgi:cytochrome P450
VAREATAPDAVGGLEIRTGDAIQIAIFMLHRRTSYWRDPAAFDPSRFATRPPEAFMPFGAGPRLCIGMAFARLEAQHLLCRAVARYRLTPVGAPPEPLGKITLRTTAPVHVKLQPA